MIQTDISVRHAACGNQRMFIGREGRAELAEQVDPFVLA